MEKLELLKKMISDIGRNSQYEGAVFVGDDDDYFAFCEDEMYVLEWSDLNYFSIEFTPEEKQEVEKIANELKLTDLTFLPIRGGVADDLQSLIEYYTDGEDDDEEDENTEEREAHDLKNKIEEIEKLQAVFEDESSIFYHRESHFLELYLYPEVEISGAPYVQSDWDHDEAYYYDLPFDTGACDLLYDAITGSYDSCVYPDVIEDLDDDEDKDNLCDRWIEILSEIDNYIVR